MSLANTAVSLPTLADIERRCRELEALQSSQPSGSLSEDFESFLDYPEASGPPHLEPDDPEPAPPPTLTEAALHGLAGDTVRALAPHSEADPAAILLQFLAAFGNLVGPVPHALVGATRHGLNLFVVLVGETSKARKGTSWRQVSGLFAEVDPGWTARRVITARPTPAGILQSLRDQPSATDRRLFLLAEEFASILHLLGRQSGQLSPLLRRAWDGGDLSAGSGPESTEATPAHISLVGHITPGELARNLGRNDLHNGFANRCLWTSVQRSKSLPEGGSVPPEQSAALVRELSRTVQWVNLQSQLVFRRTDAARALWSDCYPTLSQGRPDVYGAATSRAEAQVLRLSTLYAALDCSPLVEASHLQAALAVWEYCQASARLFFDGGPVDPAARRISEAVSASPAGLSKTQIRALFHGHISVQCIDLALEQLMTLGLISRQPAAGRGRTASLFTPIENIPRGA